MRVFLGQETFIYDFTESAKRQNPQIHKIKNIFVHPDFRSSTSENDIGILELEREIPFDSEVKPICLPGTRAKRYIDDVAVAIGIYDILNNVNSYIRGGYYKILRLSSVKSYHFGNSFLSICRMGK